MLACNTCVQYGTYGRVGHKMVVRGDGGMLLLYAYKMQNNFYGAWNPQYRVMRK